MLPILNPPPSSLPIPSLWVVPVHQPQASSIVHRTWTGDSQFLYAVIIKEILHAIYLFPLRCRIQYHKYLSLILMTTLVQTVFYLAFWHDLQIFAERQTCCCSVAKLGLILWNPKDCNIPGFPVFPSPSPRVCSLTCPSQWCHPIFHPVSPPSLPALNLFKHQGLFQWVISSHQVAKLLELQHQSI